MKKYISITLLLALTLSLLSLPAIAADGSGYNAVAAQVLGSLGILTGGSDGSLNLGSVVTREQWAKMIVASSTHRDSVSAVSNVSPFKDVPYTSWSAGYVKTAVISGYMSGYLDGTFRPQNTLKLEDAVSSILRLLGYSAADFTGSYPDAQLALYRSLKLDKNVKSKGGDIVTRDDCLELFYNALNTKTKESGKYLAETLGYSMNSSGEIDLTALLNSTMEGPIVATENWRSSLPSSMTNPVVYKNGNITNLNAVNPMDVLYYNKNTNSVWIYSDNKSGLLEKVLPGTSSPTSITLSGVTYNLGTSQVSYNFSTFGTHKVGDMITVILGKNGEVVHVTTPDKLDSTVYGFVLSSTSVVLTDRDNKPYTAYSLSIMDMEGNNRTISVSTQGIQANSFVCISFADGTATAKNLAVSNPVSGSFSSDGATFGGIPLAKDVKIIDTYDGGAVKVYPSRLLGLNIPLSKVRYSQLNSAGEINILVLNDYTGDGYSYGIITALTEISESFSVLGSYTYDIGGISTSFSGGIVYNVKQGPALFVKDGSSIKAMRNLSEAPIQSTNGVTAITANKTMAVSTNVVVYVKDNGKFLYSSLSNVNNGDYSLTGYFDDANRIRVIIANKK